MRRDLQELQIGVERSSSREQVSESVLEKAVNSLTGVADTLVALKEAKISAQLKKLEADFPQEGIDFREVKKQFEISLVEQALHRANGHQSRAAKLLRIRPTTLNSIIKRHGIRV